MHFQIEPKTIRIRSKCSISIVRRDRAFRILDTWLMYNDILDQIAELMKLSYYEGFKSCRIFLIYFSIGAFNIDLCVSFLKYMIITRFFELKSHDAAQTNFEHISNKFRSSFKRILKIFPKTIPIINLLEVF